MEANDNTRCPGFEARKALLARLVETLEPGPDGRAGLGEIYRQLEHIRPGSLDQAHARHTATPLGLKMRTLQDVALIDWAAVDYAGA